MTDLVELDKALGGDGALLDTGEVPAWVEVETVRAVVAVWCSRCREWTALYHTVVSQDPAALRRAVEKHARCKP